ncbi:MAG: helix-turn-helix domain-containing protein [Clostridia bacterium]|nr:helix-turn-helix domain-containing protein [Clostridia bacterium]
MTLEQKSQIARMREQNLGYAYIAKEMGLSVNTIKAYCRRNDLSGNRSLSDTQPENSSGTTSEIDLHIERSHGNTTTAKRPGNVEKPIVPGDQQAWDVSVSFAEEPDETAIADVLGMLTNARYGR